jgi:outer membrane lipoprotein-sorting protein
MYMFISRCAAMALIGIACSSGRAGEPLASVDSVLAKWEAASQACRTLDVQVTRFRYDNVFGGRDCTETASGRFYYEAPDVGRFEIRSNDASCWSSLRECIIWNGKETLWIDCKRRSCQKITEAQLQKTTDHGCGFWAIFATLARQLRCPQNFLPLVVDIRAADLRKRFNLTIERSGDEIWLRAVPKRSEEAANCRRITVILDAKTYRTTAIEIVDPNGKDRMVYRFDDPKLNQRPSDRQRLISPDLSGLRILAE